MEGRLAEVAEHAVIMEEDANLDLCSCGSDVVGETCPLGDDGECGDMRLAVQTKIDTAYKCED